MPIDTTFEAGRAVNEAIWLRGQGVSVLIPCYNEAPTIGKVIDDFKRELPEAEIVVYDNGSTDETAAIALRHGATLRYEKRKGKGHVIRSMFQNEKADFFLMVDGDDTYHAPDAHKLLKPIVTGVSDMCVGTRMKEHSEKSFRPLHVLGNNLVRSLINLIFDSSLCDIMSGYRAFSAEAARRIPVISKGFEVETELTIQALYYECVISEVPTAYGVRPAGSYSKLNTFSDGFRTLATIFNIFKSARPLAFFGLFSLLLLVIGLLLGSVVIYEFIQFNYIYRVPTAILASGCVVLSFLLFSVGLILDTLNFRFKELHDSLAKRPGPQSPRQS